MSEANWKCDYCLYDGQFCVLPIGHMGDHSSYTAADQRTREQVERMRNYRRESITQHHQNLVDRGLVAESEKYHRQLIDRYNSIKSTPPKFEHKILELRLYATEAELDVLGDEGWHLVSESLHEDQVRYVFCRAKQS